MAINSPLSPLCVSKILRIVCGFIPLLSTDLFTFLKKMVVLSSILLAMPNTSFRFWKGASLPIVTNAA
jgi:hypothetical protein